MKDNYTARLRSTLLEYAKLKNARGEVDNTKSTGAEGIRAPDSVVIVKSLIDPAMAGFYGKPSHSLRDPPSPLGWRYCSLAVAISRLRS
jgi:hypothetical protein